MSCELGNEKEIISKIKTIENVKEVHGTLGLYDIICKVEAQDKNKIQKTIVENLRKINHIRSTMTLMRVEGEQLFKVDSGKLVGSILGRNKAQAYVVIHCEQGREDLVVRDLNRIPEVKEADVVYGHYDVIGKIEAENYKDLEKIITKKIRNLSLVKTTMTLNVVSEQE